MKKKKSARKIDTPLSKDRTPSSRPPDRPRIFLTKPMPPPKIVWIEGGTSLLDDQQPRSSSKSRRNGRR